MDAPETTPRHPPRLELRSLWKKAAARAATATPNLASAAGAVAASAALWNPLPVLLWGIGSAAWVLFASTSESYTRRVLEEERRAAEARSEAERQALLQSVTSSLAQPPFSAWVRDGLLPDYLETFSRLSEIRDRVAKLLADRREEYLANLGIQQQLTYLLTAFLQFVRARVGYLQVLAGTPPGAEEGEPVAGGRPEAGQAAPGRGVSRPDLPQRVSPMAGPFRRPAAHLGGAPGGAGAPAGGAASSPPLSSRSLRFQAAPAFAPAAACPPLPKVEERLAELEARIAALRALAASEPVTARTREWHIGILQKQEELLRDCQRRDQQVVAQLTAVPDVFEVILGRVSAAQFSATEVATYMGGVVEQIEETERFVESMRPAMEEMRVQLESGLAG